MKKQNINQGDQVIIEIPAIVDRCFTGLNSGSKYRVNVDGTSFWVNGNQIRKADQKNVKGKKH